MAHSVIRVSRDRPVMDAPEDGQIQVSRSHRKYHRPDDDSVSASSIEMVVAAPSGCHLVYDRILVEALVGAFLFFVTPSDPFRAQPSLPA